VNTRLGQHGVVLNLRFAVRKKTHTQGNELVDRTFKKIKSAEGQTPTEKDFSFNNSM
jgi:hypothetical protein